MSVVSNIVLSSRVRRSPYFAATQRYGCKAYSVYNHMYLPLYYESPEADYWHLVNGVTLWDVAVERQVEIVGPDAARLVQRLSPRDLSSCAVGQCKYVMMTDARGGIVNDPVLLKLAEDRFWLSLADSDVLLWAKGIALAGGYDVEVFEPDVSPLQLQGPLAAAVGEALFGAALNDLKYFRFAEFDLDGMPLIVSRTGWSGERGYEIYLQNGADGDRLWEVIMEAGRPHGIKPATPSTIRRIEGGLLSYGADMTLENNPYEMNLGRLIDLEQEADFIGKASLARIAQDGVRQRLVGLIIEGGRETTAGLERAAVVRDGQAVGRVTSVAYSPRLEQTIALCLVTAEYSAEGTVLTVQPEGQLEGQLEGKTRASVRNASVSPLPFVTKKTV
ncbi:dimethylsulfoniopropionate demethylase [Pelagibius sp.]|uniref:dimethylsulfoniopropionate demethylase n=1 Tax=Pelagibius sp. TaxID=1931238 RepID=UPI002602AE20|nr:dimethylsulfoniopropionate demethylase [Pelagibius sp.]